jgi:para-aminobenzoate synthetase/4-amino-4-deoxychorismate lyase
VFLFHKTTRRAVYDSARLPDCDDVILWNPKGEVTEATIANVVVEVGGESLTPPIDCGLLAGTYRAELIARGAVREAVVTVEQLRSAQRWWLVNSVQERREAVLLG